MTNPKIKIKIEKPSIDKDNSTRSKKYLKLINKAVYPTLLVVGIFLIVWPFVGDIIFPLQQALDTSDGYEFKTELLTPELNQDKPEIPTENTLVIPQIGISSKIFDGVDESTLDLGVWRRPNTSTPDQGGNTVLTAHRFLYRSGPNTFYHLGKIDIGDNFIVYWEGKEYDYEVIDKFQVHETQIEVEDPSDEPIITLYTCTGLDAKDRLVVKGKLINSTDTAQTNE